MKHYLTEDESNKLFHAFYEDPSTEDMSWNEYLAWQGWKWDIQNKAWYKIIK